MLLVNIQVLLILLKTTYEMPRFINEKYGEIKRFETILKTLPFQFKFIKPQEKYISDINNPPKVNIEFYENLKNLKECKLFFQMRTTNGEIQNKL